MKLKIVDEEAAKRVQEAGFKIEIDNCQMMEHKHLQRRKCYACLNGKDLK